MESSRTHAADLRRPRSRPAGRLADPPHRKAAGGSTWDRLAWSGGRRLEPAMRSRLEHGLGEPLPDIRVHTDFEAANLASRESARALTFGRDIAFGSGEFQPGTFSGDALLAHEAAHAIQQEKGAGTLSESEAEASAGRASLTSILRWSGSSSAPAPIPGGGLALRRCGRNNVQRALDGSIPWTATLAHQALDQYRGMSGADRQKAFDRYYPTGAYQTMLAALTPDDMAGPYADVIRDITQKAQLAGVMESARAGGLANEAAMAQAQANLMISRNQAAAQAVNPAGPAPTTAQVAAQQQTQVAQTSIPPSSNALSPADVASWSARANTAIGTFVTFATANHPELHITAADFLVDVPGIEARGQGVVAYGQVVGGRNVVVVGRPFVRYVEANPAYAMSVVMHELRGHPEYGPYGTPGSEYGLTLYDRAAALMPGYTRPAAGTPGRTSELDAYAYQETEIYSLLRSLPYHTPLSPADAALNPNPYDPEGWTQGRVLLIKQQWDPRIAQALLHGLYRRLLLDPRITAAALHAYERAVRANYTGPEAAVAAAILQ